MISRRRQDALTRLYYPKLVPKSAIRRFAQQIVERFHPDRIILFGSYAYGTPSPDSDVDLLVVMPTRNQVEQAVRIDEAIEQRGFPLDLIVRTPKTLANRLRWGDSYLREIVARAKVLYEKNHKAVDTEAEHDVLAARHLFKLKLLLSDEICFHCQQAIEKYLKSMLAERGLPIHKTHDLTILLNHLLPLDPTLRSLRPGLKGVTRYAVEYRYPGLNTTARQARLAFQKTLLVRGEIRRRLSLPMKDI